MIPYHLWPGGPIMLSRRIALTLCLLTGLALIIAGCSSDDSDPTSPGGDSLTLTSDQAEDFSLSALSMVNELVNIVPDFAEGDFDSWTLAKAQSDSVEWDPIQEAYTFEYEGPFLDMDPPNTWTMRLGIWLQYRNAAGQAQQYPLGASEMEVDYTNGMTIHMVEGQNVADVEYDMDTNMVVSYLGEGQSYGIVGTGATSIAMSQSSSQGTQAGHFAMDWALDIASTPQGCPSGTATVHVQDFTMNATYDGQGGVSWTLAGNNYQASGVDYVNCSSPVN